MAARRCQVHVLFVFSCSLGNDSRIRWIGGGLGEFDVSSLEQIECGFLRSRFAS